MIPVQPVGPVTPATPARTLADRLTDAADLLPLLQAGERVTALVQARLSDGSFAVQVGEQTLRMQLPGDPQVGQRVALDFLSRDPRLLFATVAGAPGTPQLSDGARLVAALMSPAPSVAMGATDGLGGTGTGGPATGVAATAAPLPSALLAETPALAQALQKGVARSGLFYEAHQAQWLAGRLPLAELRREPQGVLGSANAAAPNDPTVPSTPPTTMASARLSPELQALLHPASAALVQQQLAVLDSGRLQLQLEVWPGQWMRWEIEQDEPPQDQSGDDPGDTPHTATAPEAGTWHTRMKLELPRLGTLDAELSLSADGLRVRLSTQDQASQQWLREESEDLAQALRQAGLTLRQLVVREASDGPT